MSAVEVLAGLILLLDTFSTRQMWRSVFEAIMKQPGVEVRFAERLELIE